MGLLKHAVCPFFAFAHGAATLYVLAATPASYAKMFGMPNDGPQEAKEISLRENTFMVMAGAFHMSSTFLMAVGTFWETAHVRGIVIAYECIAAGGCVLLGATKLPLREVMIPLGVFTVSLGAAIAHALEPGAK